MNELTERQRFEAYLKANWPHVSADRTTVGNYAVQHFQNRWESWQAALQQGAQGGAQDEAYAALLEAAVMTEREACALIVSPPGHYGERECSDIAASIRARPKPYAGNIRAKNLLGEIHEFLASPQPSPSSEGWVMVPREPPKLALALIGSMTAGDGYSKKDAREVYDGLLDLAPPAPAGDGHKYERCPSCDGDHDDRANCSHCGGTGRIPTPPKEPGK